MSDANKGIDLLVSVTHVKKRIYLLFELNNTDSTRNPVHSTFGGIGKE